MTRLCVVRLDPGLPLPRRAHPHDAGLDLYARESVTMSPNARVLMPTGVALEIEPGYAGFIHPRSGLAFRYGLTVVNSPGTIDAGYRGEIKVLLLNTDVGDEVVIKRGDRVAQLVIQRVELPAVVEVSEISESTRGTMGFGSSGGYTVTTC